MNIQHALVEVDAEQLRREPTEFLQDFMTPAFGSLPKREIELRVFTLLRNLGVVRNEATIHSLMTDLMVTRARASQLLFDLEIRQHGNDREKLDQLVKQALINTNFAKDGDFFFNGGGESAHSRAHASTNSGARPFL